jgi:hypothetical protein
MPWNIERTRKTKRIEGPDGKYIIIQKLNQGEKDELLDVLVQAGIGKSSEKDLKDPKSMSARMYLGQMRKHQRIRSIKEWNLTYDDGSTAPINEETVSNLPDEVVKEIDAVIQELNGQLTDEKKN